VIYFTYPAYGEIFVSLIIINDFQLQKYGFIYFPQNYKEKKVHFKLSFLRFLPSVGMTHHESQSFRMELHLLTI